MTLQKRILTQLERGYRTRFPTADIDDRGYLPTAKDNLLDGISLELVAEDFGSSAGQEMYVKDSNSGKRPKMAALHSSSALAVNTFGQWRADAASLSLAKRTGFHGLRFEAKFPILARGTPPHLDLLAVSENAVMAVESKFTEYLSRHSAHFAESYDAFWAGRDGGPWREEMKRLKVHAAAYVHLDAAQLIKHYMGLRRQMERAADPAWRGGNVTLLYVYWEPENADQIFEFCAHRKEVDEFSARVAGDDIKFIALRYLDLLSQWSAFQYPDWLPSHLQRLKQRYAFSI